MSQPTQTISQAQIQKASDGTYIIVKQPLPSTTAPQIYNPNPMANTTTYATFALAAAALATMFGETTA